MFNLLDESQQEQFLQLWAEQGKIKIASLQEYKKLKEQEKYLSMHKNTITEKTDGRWSTRLPVIERGEIQKKTKPIIKRTYEELVQAIIDHYRQLDGNPTLYDLYYEYQRTNVEQNGRQESTFTRNMSDYNRFFGEFGKRKVLDVKPEEIQNFLIDKKQEHNLTQKAYNRLVSVVKCIFGYAKAKHLISYRIDDIITDASFINTGFRKDGKPDEEMVFDEDETLKLANYFLENQTMYNLGLLLCIVTGVRGGELSALMRDECTEEYLYIHQTETSYTDPVTGKCICEVRDAPKTEKGIRNAEIPIDAAWIVPKIKQLSPGDSEWLFVIKAHKTGEVVRARTEYFRKALYRACEAVGIPRRGLHCLRRTYGSIVMDDGSISEKTITDQMGHTNINTTIRHYGKKFKSDSHIREEVSKVEAFKIYSTPKVV